MKIVCLTILLTVACHFFALPAFADFKESQLTLIDISHDPQLNSLHQDILNEGRHPIVCEMIHYENQNEQDSCRRRFRSREGQYFKSLFPEIMNLRKVFLVFGTQPEFPYKSWTNYEKETFLFVSSHSDIFDLKRSLVHEYYISQDIKYDVTLWEILSGPSEGLDAMWGQKFFEMWYKSGLIRMGLSVIRSELVEELIFSKNKYQKAGCYEHLQKRLMQLSDDQEIFQNVKDYNLSSSVSTRLAHSIKYKWNLIKKDQLISKKNIEEWIENLAANDVNEKKCLFLIEPMMGTMTNFISVGPRPRIGTGVNKEIEQLTIPKTQDQDVIKFKNLLETEKMTKINSIKSEILTESQLIKMIKESKNETK